MNRRELVAMLAAAAALGPRLAGAQSGPALKPGKPYAGAIVNVLTVVAPQFSAHEAKLAEFEALTGIKVKYQYVPFASMREKLTAELVAKTDQYDVLSVMDVWGPAMYALFDPINDRLAEKKIDMEARYPYAHLRAARDANGNGKNILGFPIRGHVQLMFYRKDLFDKLGLKPPATWDQMIEVGKQVQAKSDLAGVAMYYGKTAGQNLMIWFNYLWGMGGELLDAKGQPAFNSAQGVAATQAYIDVLLKHKVAPPGSGLVQRGRRRQFGGAGQERDGAGVVVALCRPHRCQDLDAQAGAGRLCAAAVNAGQGRHHLYQQLVLRHQPRQQAQGRGDGIPDLAVAARDRALGAARPQPQRSGGGADGQPGQR